MFRYTGRFLRVVRPRNGITGVYALPVRVLGIEIVARGFRQVHACTRKTFQYLLSRIYYFSEQESSPPEAKSTFSITVSLRRISKRTHTHIYRGYSTLIGRRVRNGPFH